MNFSWISLLNRSSTLLYILRALRARHRLCKLFCEAKRTRTFKIAYARMTLKHGAELLGSSSDLCAISYPVIVSVSLQEGSTPMDVAVVQKRTALVPILKSECPSRRCFYYLWLRRCLWLCATSIVHLHCRCNEDRAETAQITAAR